MSERLRIDRVGHRGDGVAETEAGPVFVPYTLPGETVLAEPQGERAALTAVETPSAQRVPPICPYFGECGGCATQHWDLTPYRAWKRELVVAALEQAGIDAEVGEIVDAHGAGRRRAVLHASGGVVGFTAARTHRIVPIEHCPILAPELAGALPAAQAIAAALAVAGKPLDIQVTATGNGLDIDVRGSGRLPPSRASVLVRLAERLKLARLTRHGEMIALLAPPTVTMGRARVTLPPGNFLQPTIAGEETLAALVLHHCDGAASAADLFCGVGPFALRLAERARVVAMDTDTPAIDALKEAAKTPGLKPIAAEARDLFKRPMRPDELKRIDAVVFDPPRQGAQAQARELAASGVKRVVAVSCNAASFARDARILIDGGYRLTAVTPVDQFRYSAHVEIVARFER